MSITVMQYTFNFLRFCRVWPHQNEELNPPKIFFLKFSIICLTSLVNIIGSILHFLMVSLPSNSFYHVAEDLVIITAQSGVYYHIIVYVPHQKLAAQMYEKLSDFKTFGKPPHFDKHSLLLSSIGRFYKISTDILIIMYFFEPILTKKMCERNNLERNFEDICGLVNSSWMPFNIEQFPNKQLFYLWQTFSIFWAYESSASLSFLILGTIELVLVRFWHLKVMIRETINTESEKFRRIKFKKCVDYHNYIYELSKFIDGVYENSLFVHFLFTGVLFGIIGFSIMTVGISVKIITLFAVWLTSAIFHSFSAQRLYDGSISVADEIYDSPWFERDYKFQKALLLLMQRTKKPVKIHAGPFAELSNLFIVAIFKTAYSYLTLLKAKK